MKGQSLRGRSYRVPEGMGPDGAGGGVPPHLRTPQARSHPRGPASWGAAAHVCPHLHSLHFPVRSARPSPFSGSGPSLWFLGSDLRRRDLSAGRAEPAVALREGVGPGGWRGFPGPLVWGCSGSAHTEALEAVSRGSGCLPHPPLDAWGPQLGLSCAALARGALLGLTFGSSGGTAVQCLLFATYKQEKH